MTSTPGHTLFMFLIHVFSPSCEYWSRVAEDRAGEEQFAEVEVLCGGRYEYVKGLVWWGQGLVGFRGFIAGPSGVGGNGGVFRRHLDRFSQTRLLPTISP